MRTSKLSAQAIHDIRYGLGSREEKAKRFGISLTTVNTVIRTGTTTRPSVKTEGYRPKPFNPFMAQPRTHVNAAMRETYKPEPWGSNGR